MKQFTWKVTICLVPLLIAGIIVGKAFYDYLNGRGGFKLGVDLVGGTILIYEIDPAKKPEGWTQTQAQELARRLKSRLDPSDLYNMSIRAVSETRFEIIMPTGGAHQIAAEEKVWDELLKQVNAKKVSVDGKEVPLAMERYTTPEGHVTRLLAEISAQHPEAKIADISDFIQKHYTTSGAGGIEGGKSDKARWDALLKAASEDERYKPVRYIVGRGRHAQLANLVSEQHSEVPVQEVLRAVEADETSRRRGKRGSALNTEQVQERKELIAQQGSLEFRILASNEFGDGDAISQATAYFKSAKAADELRRLAFLGEPPPPPTTPDGSKIFETKLGRHTYAWVELGPYYRSEERHRLSNPRDKNGNVMNEADVPKDDPKYRMWRDAAEARKLGQPMFFEGTILFSREVPRERLSEKDRDKKYEYFVLTREKEVGSEAVTGDMLAYAAPGNEGNVLFRIKPEFSDRFREFTSKNKGQSMAIILDGMIESAATIQSAISTNGQITMGTHASRDKIEQTVKILRSGALPATLKPQPVSENTMGPTLGADTIRSGAYSVLLAFGAVLVFMLLYYRFSGLVACLALFANLLLTVAFMVVIDATFTLPGLAGLVLMLGMAVDANILIYERLREERERGATLSLALRNGYDRALPTIIDTHLSSIFTAVVLYIVGNDQLKGFGISLTVGLIISLFTSLYMTRVVFDYWQARGWLTKLSMFRMFAKPNIDFMAIRHYWFAATVLLTIVGAALFIYRLDTGSVYSLTDKKLQTLSTIGMPAPVVLKLDAIKGKEFKDQADFEAALAKSLSPEEMNRFRDELVKSAREQTRATVLNIDFIGGTAYSGELIEKMDIEHVRAALEKSKLPDLSVEQIFLSDPNYSEGTKSKLFTVRTSNKNPKEVLDAINNTLGEGGAKKLKAINLSDPVFLADQKTVVLSFTDPNTGDPTYASRAQISMLLAQKIDEKAKSLSGSPDRARALETLGKQFTLEGLGRENEGRFQWMELHLPDVTKDVDDLKAVLAETQLAFRNSPQPERLEVFDSQLAAETQLRALYAILASWAAILLYLWFRFGNWTFGAAAVLCLVHDLFFTLGMIAGCHYIHDTAFGRMLGVQDFKIDLPTVAALLTLVGYSVNDTIVVFDRIREVRGKNPDLTPQIINDSINQTLSRTILTSLSVWLVVIVLYIWGGEGVHLFAFVMVVGVVVGTYSSIYIASPLLLIFGEGKTTTGATTQKPRPEAPVPAPTAPSTGIISGPSTGIKP